MKKILDWFSYTKEPELCLDLKARNIKALQITAAVCWLIMVAAQLIIFFRFDGPQLSDSAGYLKNANECLAQGLLYPSPLNLYNHYIQGSGIVNLLLLIYQFTDSLKPFFAINILLVQLLLFSCIYILKKIFKDSTIHYWFTILFCLLATMWAEIANVRTEIPFTALCFCAVALLYSDRKFKSVGCGVLLAVANWVRPLGIVAIAACVFIIIYKKDKFRHILGIAASYVCIILIIGGITASNCGSFIYQSTTLGYNLIMTANDDADGSYTSEVFNEGMPGYIPPEKEKEMTYKDFDEYYKDISIDWIKKNPVKYIMQTPKKLFYLYATETYANSTMYNNEINTSGISYIKGIAAKLTGNSAERFYAADAISCFNQGWYMMTLLLFVIGTVVMIKLKKWRGMLPLYIMMAGFTAVVVIIVGGARYHFPMLPIILMSASVAAQYLTSKTGKKPKKD